MLPVNPNVMICGCELTLLSYNVLGRLPAGQACELPPAFCTLPNTHSHSSDVWIRTEQNHTEVLVRCQPASLKVNELALETWAAFFTLSIGFLK